MVTTVPWAAVPLHRCSFGEEKFLTSNQSSALGEALTVLQGSIGLVFPWGNNTSMVPQILLHTKIWRSTSAVWLSWILLP